MQTVLIPTHGRPTLLKRTLDSYVECQLPDSYRQVIVVENGSQSGAQSLVEQMPSQFNAKYLYYPEGNKSAALNFALKQVDDDHVVFFDDDVRISSETLCAYEQAFEAFPDQTYFGGPFGVDYETEPPEWLQLPPSARGWSLSESQPVASTEVFYGCNWAARAEDLRNAGGFDPNVGPGGYSGGRGQEEDMQLRLGERGMTGIYVPGAFVWHWVPESRSSTRWSLERIYQNAVTSGMAYPGDERRYFGIPGWVIRMTLKKWAARIGIIGASERKRYSLHLKYYYWSGYAYGMRFAYKESRRRGD